jgi:aminoglycoside phosphotransferase (APT) family kinase protein
VPERAEPGASSGGSAGGPADAAGSGHDLGERLAEWAAARWGGDVVVLAPATPVAGGFDAEIVRIQLGGAALAPEWRRPLVLRALPSAERSDDACDEAAVLAWCAERGYPVPEVLAVIEPGTIHPGPVQVMLRVPGVTMADIARRRPWRARALVTRLADLHLRLHALATAGWPLTATPTALADRRLSVVRAQVASGEAAAPIAAALARVEALVPATATDEPVVCHGDFHPLNILVEGPTANVVDWTDCALGDRHGDVARTALLFELATIAASNRLEHEVLARMGARLSRRYLAAYRRGFELDPARLRLWTALHLVDGIAQAARAPDRVPPGFAVLLQQRTDALLDELAAG